MKIFIAGAGMMGRTIANLLSEAGNQVSIADADLRSLNLVAREGIGKLTVDVRDSDALTASARDHDIVISALPYFLNPPVAQAAHDIHAHYFDLTEDVATTEAVRRIASEAETAFIPQCGLAPGFISIATHGLTQNFDTLHAVKMRVGALPRYPTNRLKYNLTWSTDGVINEYCNPCDALRDGKRVSLAPLEDVEHLIIDGVEYESFNTSGGLGTLCATLEGKVGDLDYQTLRYPGHRDAMKFLLDDLRLRKRREILKDILESSIPVTTQDVVLIFVSVTGLRGGKLIQESFVRKIHGGKNKDNYSAIQITTASSLCAMVELLQKSKIPRRGFVRQEDASLADFLATSYAREVYGASAGR